MAVTVIKRAIERLRMGQPVLLFDAEGREEETDIVIASEHMTPELLRFMRKDGGGLICVTVPSSHAEILGLPYLHDLFQNSPYEIFRYLQPEVRYDTRPAFSITINHRSNYTGIPDIERAKTIREFALFIKNIESFENPKIEFGARFVAPGHVHILISSGLKTRQGHTELSTALVEMAGLAPSASIVEMLGDDGYALSKKDALKFAEKHKLVFVEGKDVMEAWERWSE